MRERLTNEEFDVLDLALLYRSVKIFELDEKLKKLDEVLFIKKLRKKLNNIRNGKPISK